MRYPEDFFATGGRRIPVSADIVIVGGGMAGLELAKELHKRGARDIVVVEAGPSGDGTHLNARAGAVEALDMWLDADNASELWRPWKSLTPPHYTRHGGLRRRLGGRSLYWHGVVLPLEPWALSAPSWPEGVVDDLTTSWRGGECLYDVVRSELATWVGGATDRDQQIKFDEFVLRPTPKAIRPTDESGGWEAYHPISHWLETGKPPAKDITFVPGHTVLGVVVRGSAAKGVVCRADNSSAETVISCDTVVLAAGTIENARLAIQARYDAGYGGSPRLPGLVDHIEQGIIVVAPTKDLPADLAVLCTADSAHHVACDEETRTHLFTRLYPAPGSGGELSVLELYATGEQERAAESHVRCDNVDGWPWQTSVRTQLSVRDRKTVSAGRAILTKVWYDVVARTGFPVAIPDFPNFADPERTASEVLRGMGRGELPVAAPVAWCSLLGTVDHEAGVLPFGQLIDEDHQMFDVRGLYATGPASFSRAGAANPSLTTLALSRRLAERLTR